MNKFKQGDTLLFETIEGEKFGCVRGKYYDQEQSVTMYYVEIQSKRQIFLISQYHLAYKHQVTQSQFESFIWPNINKQKKKQEKEQEQQEQQEQQKQQQSRLIKKLLAENKRQVQIFQNKFKREKLKQDDTRRCVKNNNYDRSDIFKTRRYLGKKQKKK